MIHRSNREACASFCSVSLAVLICKARFGPESLWRDNRNTGSLGMCEQGYIFENWEIKDIKKMPSKKISVFLRL